MKVISREDARRSGMRYFFTGEPCNNGHVTYRRVNKGNCIECQRIYARNYWQSRPDKMVEFRRSYVKRNRERVREENRKQSIGNPQWSREYMARRRARKKNQICVCCARPDLLNVYRRAKDLGLHVDHIWPLSKGGPHCRFNMQFLSLSENSKKGARFGPREAMRYMFNLSVGEHV